MSDRVRHPNVLFMESYFEDEAFFYIVLVDQKCDSGGDFDPNRQNFSYPRVPEG
eukprot:COSAG02_NODE_28249_length_593_cov_0.809717_2_plen_53_part_01